MTFAENIVNTYADATDAQREEGMAWYGRARVLAAEISPDDIVLGAGIIAMYSIRRRWPENVIAARETMATRIPSPGLGMIREKSQAMLDGGDVLAICGEKTRNFVRNIVGEPSFVTVDVHARDIAYGHFVDRKTAISKSLYAEISDAYILAASAFNIAPSDMQAVTWVVWRDIPLRDRRK